MHPRSYEQEDFRTVDPLHYLFLAGAKDPIALDQAAPLAHSAGCCRSVFAAISAAYLKRGWQSREAVNTLQVLRLIESFSLDDVRAAISEALERGVIGFDAVKHLVLCRIEKTAATS